MKRLLVLLLGAFLVLSIGVTGAGCAAELPFGEVADNGKVEVRVTDAPPGEEIDGIMVMISGVEIHKAGTEQEGEGIQQQENQQKGNQQQKANAEGNQSQGQAGGLGKGKQGNGNQAQGKGKQGNGNQAQGQDSGNTSKARGQEENNQNNLGKAGWIELPVRAEVNTFDLLEIKGIEKTIATDEIEAGKYTQLRMTIEQVQVTIEGREPQVARLPSGELKFITPIDITAGKTTVVVLDFDADKSVTFSGSGDIIVRPVVKLFVRYEDATVPQEVTGNVNGELIMNVDEEGNTTINNERLQEAIGEAQITGLTQEETDGILYMREEEKLARDVYLQLYEEWGINNFSNIANSEESHMEAVKSLIDEYGLTDPAEGKGIGEFTNPELQQLHDELLDMGSQSEVGALKVGAAIEEIDIIDLEEELSQTDKADIQLVYSNLLKGSRNHLRSFVKVLDRYGVEYEPQYLAADQYDQIIESSIERDGR